MEEILRQIISGNPDSAVVNILTDWAAEYIEGGYDVSQKKFNHYFELCPKRVQMLFITECPWEILANKLARKIGVEKPWIKVGEHQYEKNPKFELEH